MSKVILGPHALHMHLQGIKYACEVMGDYERVVVRVDDVLAHRFDEDMWKLHSIEDIRHALEMIALFAYSHCKDEIMYYIGIIRTHIDNAVISQLLVAKRLQGNTTRDMGCLDDLPTLVRQKVFNEVMTNL